MRLTQDSIQDHRTAPGHHAHLRINNPVGSHTEIQTINTNPIRSIPGDPIMRIQLGLAGFCQIQQRFQVRQEFRNTGLKACCQDDHIRTKGLDLSAQTGPAGNHIAIRT